MSDYTNARAITIGDLRRAFDTVANAAPQVCGVSFPHLVHPNAEGWTGCANLCGSVFYVEIVDGIPQIADPPPTDGRIGG